MQLKLCSLGKNNYDDQESPFRDKRLDIYTSTATVWVQETGFISDRFGQVRQRELLMTLPPF